VNRAAALALALVASTAAADRRERPRPQVQIDLGAAVVGLGLETPIAAHLALQMEAIGFSTFYLPLVGGGVTTNGYGAGVRGTWFAGRDGRGLFVTPFFRFAHVAAEKDTGDRGHGLATATGITVGQAFRATPTVDLRFGFGAQLLHYDIHTKGGALHATTPFLAFDLVIGFRR
jgi:hypothetical protein